MLIKTDLLAVWYYYGITFLFQANYLNENYYQDLIDERNCVKLCGYALCSSVLNNVPKQQYHISATQKKVFDITERKVSIYFTRNY